MKLNLITKAVLLASLTSITSHVFAQEEIEKKEPEAKELKIEQITVTARKMKESSQEVPVSMSVITSDALDKIAAFDFQDLSKLSPGLEISGDDAISGTIKIRGVGRDAFAGNMDDSVVVFIDGVAQTSVGAAFGSLSDIARVEVLRGPQGTLYGKNAPAGAINITTKSIDMYEVGGGFTTSHFYTDETSTYGTSNKAHLNLPLIEGELGMRVSGFYDDDEGYIHNDYLNTPANDSKREGARVKLQYIPTDNLDITFIGNYSDNYNARPFGYIPGYGPDYIAIKEAQANGTPASSDTFESTLGTDIPLGSPDDFRVFSDIESHSKTRLKDAQLNFNWDTETHSLTSITYYQEVNTKFVSDQNGTPITDGLLEIESNQNLFSQELRLSNIDNDVFDYLVGFYYSKSELEGPDDGSAGSQFQQFGVRLPAPVPFPPFVIMAPADIRTSIYSDAETESLGYFGHLNYHINENWTVSGGLRYNDETKAIKSDFFVDGTMHLFGMEIPFPETALPGIPASEETYTNLSGSFKVQYKQDEDIMYYLALDTAYRSGGFNSSTLEPLESLRTFEPEESTALEIGMKGSFLDQRLQWNIDFYYQVFDNYQFGDLPRQDNNVTRIFVDVDPTVPVNSLTLNQSHVLNAKEAISQGIETDFIYLVSENFVLSGALTYIDTEYKEFMGFCDTGEGPIDQMYCDFSGRGIGSNFGIEPASFSANLQPLYHTDINDWGVSMSNSLQINYDDVQEFRVDYHLGFEPLEGDWSVKVFVKNLLNAESGNVRKVLINGSTDTYNYDAVRPLQVGVTFGYNF